jgi:signal peptidase I
MFVTAQSSRWRRVRGVCATVFLGALVAALALCFVALLFLFISPSYHAYVITGGSMTPAVNLGDVVIVGPPGGLFGHPLAPGRVVTFQAGDGLVTHRIVSMAGGELTTRGDAVGENDTQALAVSAVKGVVLARLPKLGLVPRFLRSRHSLPLLVLIPACICLFVVLVSLGNSVRHRVGLWRRVRRHEPAPAESGSRWEGRA